MKSVTLLVALAVLAGGTAHATTVSFASADSGVSGSAYNSLSFGGGAVTATGFFWDDSGAPINPSVWATTTVRFLTNTPPDPAHGVGVTNTTSNSLVQGSMQEYILLDFGAGVTTISTIQLYLSNVDNNNQYFTYAWVSAPPVAGATSPAVPLTAVSQTPTPAPSNPLAPGSYTFNFSTGFGSGRYLLLGSTNHAGTPTESNFRVQNVTYSTSSVPDGASTLALMGAAVAVLGLAARRRRD
jgi:MYXO-CTERM domain-containing protein